MWTTTADFHTMLDAGLPPMATGGTEPVCPVSAASSVVTRRAGVVCCVPVPGNLGSSAGKRVVGTHFVTRTEGAASAMRAMCDCCFPSVWMPVRTVSTSPVHFAAAFWLDDNAAKVNVLFVVPLVLQRVVGTHFVTRTEGAASAMRAMCDCCFPSVWMPVRTVSTSPVHFAAAFWLDDNAAKVNVLFVVPLVLQLRTQLTDVWPALLLLSWQYTAV